ncbi:MAG: N-acetyltransferase [Candidatus Aminicenantes bacterium]|nr:MAG: N-acetyltransferase [Candidatus Aminicenantes bacterium]
MIREYTESDLESVIKIWLDASVQAHDFVDRNFWQAKADDMRKIYIPKSETWVYLEDNLILGFFSLLEDTLAALFVSPNSQGKGIGQRLIAKAKSLRQSLKLTVYSENFRSIEFYMKQGFATVKEQIDEHTGHKEMVMVYNP